MVLLSTRLYVDEVVVGKRAPGARRRLRVQAETALASHRGCDERVSEMAGSRCVHRATISMSRIGIDR
jgi:hypothetical protein